MNDEGNAVAQVAPLKQALALAAEAGDINALKDVAAMGAALHKGAKARGLGITAENQAAEVIIRAERAIGQVLLDMADRGERLTSGQPNKPYVQVRNGVETAIVPQVVSPSLQDLGIRSDHASIWQRLARIPQSTFEDKVAGLLATGERFAKMDFYRLVKGGEKKQKAALVDIREAMHADDATPAFRAFEKAAIGLSIDTLPEDELAKVGGLLRGLLTAYNERYARLSHAA